MALSNLWPANARLGAVSPWGRCRFLIFKTPWVGDPRINIQNDKGKAKPYQVRQVLLAIQKLQDKRNEL